MAVIAYINAFKDEFNAEDLAGASLITITLIVVMVVTVIVTV